MERTPLPVHSRRARVVAIALACAGGLLLLTCIAGAITIHLATRGYEDLRDAVRAEDALAVRCFLIKGADVNALHVIRGSALHEAARLGCAGVAKLLIAHGANVNLAVQTGRAPLHDAALYGNGEVAQLLLDSGADINAAGKSGWTPLHDAVTRPSDRPATSEAKAAVTRLLASKGANVGAGLRSDLAPLRVTPLHLAAMSGYRICAEPLIDYGADVNARDHTGATPLHHGAEGGHLGVVELLLEQGAEPDARDDQGRTPLDWAAGSGRIRELLRKQGTKQ